MCRIAGIFNPRSPDLAGEIARMRDAMRRGGPDDEGVYLDPDLPLALGHRRLAIIDLSPAGHQPMGDLDGRLQLVFNGEIYNFRELRAELEGLGHRFISHSDTEVVLKAYQQWGCECFRRFNGMFALALFDRRSSEVVLARDHAGIKPLYYQLAGDSLYFASEIRAFRDTHRKFTEDPGWRVLFLTFGHLPEPVTTLENVTVLEKGHWLRISLPGLKAEKRAFAQFRFTDEVSDPAEAERLVRETLSAAVRRHLIADAPLGIFLSGGIDSSALTLLAAPHVREQLRTLSIYFEEAGFSEEPFQRLVAAQAGSDHHAYRVSRQDFDSHLPDVLEAMDQPTVDGINSYFISMFARASGLKAVLAGHGADELFGGYASFGLARRYRQLARLPGALLRLLDRLPDDRLRKATFAARKDPVGEYLVYRGIFTPRAVAALLGMSERGVAGQVDRVRLPGGMDALADVNRVSRIETDLYLQNQLLKDTDSMSMWHGLEVRVPFLDLELMKLVHRISAPLKLHPGVTKVLLVRAMGEDLPPAIWNRPKQGFTFPFERWMLDAPLTQPRNPGEGRLYRRFRDGQLSWGRYWCAVLVDRFPGARPRQPVA